jgi:aryl-alcohol dehydrogenase-like predicted oxidoreductase
MVNSTLHLCGNTKTWSTHGADGPLFQELLAVLKQTADKHRVSIANAGVRYVLERPAVAGVIVGTRLGVAQHLDDNARVVLQLTAKMKRRSKRCSRNRATCFS